ncbi:S-layer homology domain-containing protein [Lysinibacillus capsici]|uniref:S-layer homology domain-containing protein n=1 Tax=Lysinibacillus capsici TaxID=2115968 RepID=UPI002E1DFB8B|nr:S-layer homology domain-containing protein [Lysinibacillus capsici]
MKRKLIYTIMFVLFCFVFLMNHISVSASGFDDIKKLPNQMQQEVQDLTKRNIIKGTTPTTFSPNTTITRGQVVVMMGRYIEQNGIAKVDKNWEEMDRFMDMPLRVKDRELLKYSTLLYDNGIFKGENGRLNPYNHMTREQMALTLNRLMVLARNYSLIDYAYDLQSDVLDIQKANKEARPYIEALNALGISNVDTFNPKNSVTRVQFASFLSRTIKLIERNHHVIHFEKTAEELGFQKISNVTPINKSHLQVSFSNSLLHIYARYDGNFAIDEEVLIEGTCLFGRPHESRLQLRNQFMQSNAFSIVKKYIPGQHGYINMNLFLMHSFTDAHYKLLDTGKEYGSEAGYLDKQGISMYFINSDSGIIEHTINGTVLSMKNEEIIRTPKTVHYRYYFDYQGVMVSDTDAMNHIGDKRYTVTNNGDVLFEGKVLKDRTFYYLPIIRPVPFHTYNDDIGGFTYTDDVTLQQILAFHKTDGQKSSIPRQYMHPKVLVIDGKKNIYGTINLRDATFGTFEEIKNY